MKLKERVKCIPIPGIENGYLVISGQSTETGNKVKPVVSFLYVRERKAVEWEVKYGPITKITACDENHPEAREHWFFDYCTGFGDWTQLAVEDKKLPEAFVRGDYQHIFDVLKLYCN